MKLTKPYGEVMLRIARRVVWYEEPDRALANVAAFLAQVMVYGSESDVRAVEGEVGQAEFRKVLEAAPAGVFTQEAWDRWHERLGMSKRPLPRRQFPGGWEGPEAGGFLGR